MGHIKQHHGDAIHQIQDVGNSTGQMTQVLKKKKKVAKKEKKKRRKAPMDKRGHKNISLKNMKKYTI